MIRAQIIFSSSEKGLLHWLDEKWFMPVAYFVDIFEQLNKIFKCKEVAQTSLKLLNPLKI